MTVKREDSWLENFVGMVWTRRKKDVTYLGPKLFNSFSHFPVMTLRPHRYCLDLKLNPFPVLFHLDEPSPHGRSHTHTLSKGSSHYTLPLVMILLFNLILGYDRLAVES